MNKKNIMIHLLRDETGASALEYGFIAACIFLVIVASVASLGERTAALFDAAQQGFNSE